MPEKDGYFDCTRNYSYYKHFKWFSTAEGVLGVSLCGRSINSILLSHPFMH